MLRFASVLFWAFSLSCTDLIRCTSSHGGVRIPVPLSWGPSFGLGFVVASPAGVILNRTCTLKHTHIGSSCRGLNLAEQFPMAQPTKKKLSHAKPPLYDFYYPLICSDILSFSHFSPLRANKICFMCSTLLRGCWQSVLYLGGYGKSCRSWPLSQCLIPPFLTSLLFPLINQEMSLARSTGEAMFWKIYANKGNLKRCQSSQVLFQPSRPAWVVCAVGSMF